MLTFEELCEKLYRVDEVSLLETLELTSEDIVNAFRDRIEERQEELTRDFIIDLESWTDD